MDKKEKVDAILVLGHMIKDKSKMPDILESRIRKAEQLYKRFRCKVILSGGKRRKINEAHFMEKYIKVPKKMLILEDESRNTKTNAIFCKRIILKNNFESIIIVTSTYHLFRAFIVFKNVLPWRIKVKMAPAIAPIRLTTRFALFFIEIFKIFKDLSDLDFNPVYRRMKNS